MYVSYIMNENSYIHFPNSFIKKKAETTPGCAFIIGTGREQFWEMKVLVGDVNVIQYKNFYFIFTMFLHLSKEVI